MMEGERTRREQCDKVIMPIHCTVCDGECVLVPACAALLGGNCVRLHVDGQTDATRQVSD